MREIIKAIRGFSDYTPAIGKWEKITEIQLCERLLVLGSYKKAPSNSIICDAIRSIRHLFNTKPNFENGIYFWVIFGEDLKCNSFEFRVTASDFIVGDKFGRYLPESEKELTDYQDNRYADAANQKKNANAAGYAAHYFVFNNQM